MIMSNSMYDILNKIQRWLPALAVFYLALCQIWGLPYGDEVNKTVLAISALMAATLEISTSNYHASNVTDLLYSMADIDEDEAGEPEKTDEPEQAE